MTVAPGRLCDDTLTHHKLIPHYRVPIEQALGDGGKELIKIEDDCHGIASNACEAGAAISLSPVFAKGRAGDSYHMRLGMQIT